MSTLGPEWERTRQSFWRLYGGVDRVSAGFDLLVELPADIGARDAMATTRECLMRVGQVFADRLRESAAKLTDSVARSNASFSLFPYLPMEVSLQFAMNEEFVSGLERALQEGPLAGRMLEVGNAMEVALYCRGLTAGRPFAGDLMLFHVDMIRFDEGSLYQWIKGRVAVLTLGATLFAGVVPIVAGPVDEYVQREVAVYRFNERVAEALKDQPMVTYRGFYFDESRLGYFAGNSFNYEEPGISSDERRNRISLMQLAIKMDLGTTLVIDGEMGPDTQRHMVEMGKKYHHPPSVTNPFFQADLLRALHPVEK